MIIKIMTIIMIIIIIIIVLMIIVMIMIIIISIIIIKNGEFIVSGQNHCSEPAFIREI